MEPTATPSAMPQLPGVQQNTGTPLGQAAQMQQPPEASLNQPQLTLKALRQKQAQFDQAVPQNPQAAITKATALLGSSSKSTINQVGKAIQTPNYAGYCLAFVDDQTGNTNRQPTAYADYQVHAAQGAVNSSAKDIPDGARVYWAPDSSNGGMGHVGLSNGDGTFTSATDNGIQTFSLADWAKYAGQKFLGWAK